MPTVKSLGSILLFCLSGLALVLPVPIQAGDQPATATTTNALTGLHVTKDARGRWFAEFDYVYSGDPPNAFLWGGVGVASSTGAVRFYHVVLNAPMVEPGRHHVRVEIQRPDGPPNTLTTTKFSIDLRTFRTPRPGDPPPAGPQDLEPIIARQEIDAVIKWPTAERWLEERMYLTRTPDQLLEDVIPTIDRGIGIENAKPVVERIIADNPTFAPAYLELARISMKSNWSQEGLHQAEEQIGSALRIAPDDANARILLGYVYVHQKRHAEAEKLFKEAAGTSTGNLWLWANWGELLVAQGRIDQGIEKYKEAIKRPRSKPTYDRARLDAYEKLLVLLEKKGDAPGMESLLKQRVAEFGEEGCYNAELGRFILQRHGDAPKAAELARKEIDGPCSQTGSKEVLGMTNYLAWSTGEDAAAQVQLDQARVNLPIGPRAIYLLATSDNTLPPLKKLIARGEAIDQRDGRRLTALARAVEARDYAAAARLVRLGARMDLPVGFNDLPVALIPVIAEDIDGIKQMKKLGVNYATLKVRGVSVLDEIKRSGNRRLIDALGAGASRI